MRSQFNLQASPCMDCCVHFCCESCALCQEYKELENRGFNMAKGLSASYRERKFMFEKAPSLLNHALPHNICRMGREQQDGWVCAKHESTRKARDVLLERACMALEFTSCDDSKCCINGFMRILICNVHNATQNENKAGL